MNKMSTYSNNRPQTSKYRNQSHIHFEQQNLTKQLSSSCICTKPKKRPQSYRNISKISQFMNDNPAPIKQTSTIQYSNVIQNRKQYFNVPKNQLIPRNQQSLQFQNFFQKTGQKMYKPIDQFTQYSDLLNRNSHLLRRGQFNTPLLNGKFSRYKKDQNNEKTSKYNTRYKTTVSNFKLSNTIAASLYESIKQKKTLKKQKQIFIHKTQKYIKPVNKTFLGYADQYDELMNKERQNNQKVSLKNAMNRVLTMQLMGKKINNLTQLYI